ncbi:hypothetical protein AAW12_07555 [Sphingobacterium sp. Ag1]|uniref:hypothetical protein n=1 Tax=Sphingobacterium sp. Ag1 TaxID=1643451 RepID=UPI0006276A76|nr:hypothetical protein [Sphingobacterium sp. Ag1]KKO91995.1 hypothetical protein AAW12_07555 [Sphingobacterium sp. Ag1]
MKSIGKFLQWSVAAAFIFVIIFWGNSYRYFIYALVCSALLYFLLQKMILRKLGNGDAREEVRYDVNGKRITMQGGKRMVFAVLLVAVYILIISVFSVSPSLERKEFVLTHPSWVATAPAILNFESKIHRGKTKYAYLNIEYRYTANGQQVLRKLDKAEKHYAFLPVMSQRRFEGMRTELLDRAKRRIADKEYILFYNPQNIEQQTFFLADDSFYLQGSWLYDILFVYLLLFLFIVIIVFLFRKDYNNRMKKSNSTIHYYRRTDYYENR